MCRELTAYNKATLPQKNGTNRKAKNENFYSFAQRLIDGKL
jgi:hypothetical protein